MKSLSIGNQQMTDIAVRGVRNATTLMQIPMERLTTGKKINRAADDVGRIGMLSQLAAQIQSVKAATQNTIDAISLLDVASGALDSSSDLISRIREIAVQASSGSLTVSNREALIDEKGLLVQELTTTAQNTEFAGQKLLDGNFTARRVQLGISATDYSTISLTTADPDYLGAYVSNGTTRAALTAATGTSAADQRNSTTGSEDIVITSSGAEFTVEVSAQDSAKTVAKKINTLASSTFVSADASTFAHLSSIDGSDTTYTISVNGTSTSSFAISSSDVSGAVTAINLISGSTNVTATATASNQVLLHDSSGEDITIENSAAGTGLRVVAVKSDGETEVSGTISLQASGSNDTTRVIGTLRMTSGEAFDVTQSGNANLGYVTTGSASLSNLTGVSLSDATTSASALAIIDAALEQISKLAGTVGAHLSSMDFNLNGLYSTSDQLMSSEQSINAADFALETAKLAKALVLQKASAAILAQANASADLVLVLLEDAA